MRSLRSLTFLFLVAFALATGLAAYVTYTATHLAIIASVDRRIASVSDLLLDDAPSGDAAALLRRIDTVTRSRENGDIGFALRDGRGAYLGGNIRLARTLAPGFASIDADDRIAGLSAGRALNRAAGGGLWLTTVAETEPIDGYHSARLRSYVLGFGLIALVVLSGTVAFGLIVRRRIAATRATAEAIVDGDLSHRVPVTGDGGSFDAQAIAFNRMLARIELLVENVRSVGGDVAHDLRTPLARLRGRLSRLAEEAPSAAVEAALDDCDGMLSMFAAILRIAEVEGGDRRAAFAPVALDALVEEVCEGLGEATVDADHALIVATSPVEIVGDRQLLAQALYNLVENALHHSPPGTEVRVGATQDANAVTIRVADNGPGIAPADRDRALRRFGRLDASRSRSGHGLGLPLAAAVARLHRGTLTLGDAAPGLLVTMTLPR